MVVVEGEVTDECYPNCVVFNQRVASVNAITQLFVGLHKICTSKFSPFLY